MINRVIVVGRLVRDVELKRTNNNMYIVQFSIANESYSKSRKEKVAYFFDCVCFGSNAENFVKYVKKGSLIALDGHLTQENYTNRKGQNVSRVKIIADSIQYLDTRSDQNAESIPNYPQSKNVSEVKESAIDVKSNETKKSYATFDDDALPF